MSKIRTVTDLQESIDDHFSWRLKELADIKRAVKAKDSLSTKTLIRAGVPLLYAHWEGFIKKASEAYLRFVADQRLAFDELASCFIVFGAKTHLVSLKESRKSRVNIEAVEFFLDKLGNRAVFPLSDSAMADAVNTESNLSSAVFSNIAISLGIELAPYEAYFNLIDEGLLMRRNRIAHGELLELTPDDFRDLADEVIKLMRRYKTDIENNASQDAFRRK